jgi:hypothetical protein
MLTRIFILAKFKTIIFSIYLLLSLPSFADSDENIIAIDNLNELYQKYQALYQDYDPKDILLVFGVQKVIFKPLMPVVGQPNKNLLADLYRMFKTIKSEKLAYFDTIMLTSSKNELVDPNLPKFIKEAMGKGSPVIAFDNGLTGNFNDIKLLEIWKAEYLKKFNIDLSNSFPRYNYLIFNNMEPFENTYPTFYNGILSNNNDPLYQLILSFIIEVSAKPKVLIMISGNLNELNSVRIQLKNYDDNIMFIGYHCRSSEKNALQFNEKFSENEIKKLYKELIDKTNMAKRNNPKLKVKNKENINPYDNKK